MTTTTQTSLGKVLTFLQRLEQAKIWYRLEHIRDAMMINVAIPGERWEIEFFEDGHVEVERFLSPGEMEGEEAMERLLADHAGRQCDP